VWVSWGESSFLNTGGEAQIGASFNSFQFHQLINQVHFQSVISALSNRDFGFQTL